MPLSLALTRRLLAATVTLTLMVTPVAAFASPQPDDSTTTTATATADKPRAKKAKKPVVKKLSVREASPLERTRVTIVGTNFDKRATVLFGTKKVPRKQVRFVNKRKLTAIAPFSALGTVPVRVKTRKGLSAKSRNARFTYRNPDPVAEYSTDLAAETQVLNAAQLVSVTRNGDDQNPSWTVTYDSAPPARLTAGTPLYLEPDQQVAPEGLAGVIQARDGNVLTVVPGDLDELFDRLTIDLSTPLGTPRTAARRGTGDIDPIDQPPGVDAGFLSCSGTPPVFNWFAELSNAQLSLRVDVGNLVATNIVEGVVTADLKSGFVAGLEGGVECELNLERLGVLARDVRVPALPAVALRIRPVIRLTGTASLTYERTTLHSIAAGFSASLKLSEVFDEGFRSNSFVDAIPIEEAASQASDPEVSVALSAGLGFDISLLDSSVLGLSVEPTVGIEWSKSASADDISDVSCFIRAFATVDAFVRLWKYDHTFLSVSKTLLESPSLCGDPPAFDGFPKLATTQIGPLYLDEYVFEFLDTEDERPGTWSLLDDDELPDGLQLDAGTGKISGVLSADFGTYPVNVFFRDEYGRTETGSVDIIVADRAFTPDGQARKLTDPRHYYDGYDGSGASTPAYGMVISGDGRTVAFSAQNTGYPSGLTQVWVSTPGSTEPTLVSKTAKGKPGNGTSGLAGLEQDGQRLWIVTNAQNLGGSDFQPALLQWEAATGKLTPIADLVGPMPGGRTISHIVPTAAGRYALLTTQDASVFRWDRRTGGIKQLPSSPRQDFAGYIKLSDDGNTIHYVTSDRSHYLYDVSSETSRRVTFGVSGPMLNAQMSNDGSTMVGVGPETDSSCSQCRVRVEDITSQRRTVVGGPFLVGANLRGRQFPQLSGNGKRLLWMDATGDSDDSSDLRLRNLVTGQDIVVKKYTPQAAPDEPYFCSPGFLSSSGTAAVMQCSYLSSTRHPDVYAWTQN